jgi:PmbA protein
MEQLLAIARKSADKVEVYSRTINTDGVNFENAELKDIDSKLLSGVSLRLFKAGKVGTAHTQNLIDREELVRNAMLSLKGGVEADYDLPETSKLPKLITCDPEIGKLTNRQLVDECARITAAISARTKSQVNANATRTKLTIRLLNSEGTDLAAEFSNYSSIAMAMFPGSYASIAQNQDGKKFEAFPDWMIEQIATTYNAALKEVKPAGGRMNVLFLPAALFALVWRLREGANAKNIYEKTSRLRDQLGKKLLSEKLTIMNEPLNDKVPGARAFDDEGIPCRNLPLFEAGVLKSFYCDLCYGRKLNLPSTGNGFRNDTTTPPTPALEHLTIQPGDKSFSGLIGLMKKGIIVGGAMGAHSGNILNGDYSIGLAPGIYVENGAIAGRVKDAMVAGNVYETMQNVVAIEDKVYASTMGRFPAVLFDDVRVAM